MIEATQSQAANFPANTLRSLVGRKCVKRFVSLNVHAGLLHQKCLKSRKSKIGFGKIAGMKKELYRCDVCKKELMLASGKRHWCDCNPSAPFYMNSVRSSQIVDRLVNGFTSRFRRPNQ